MDAGFFGYFQSVFDRTLGSLFNPSSFLSIFPLVVAFVIALLVLYKRWQSKPGNRKVSLRRLLRAMFPKRIFLHDSAIIDYLLFIINNGFLFFLSASIVITPALFAGIISNVFVAVGLPVTDVQESLPEKIALTIMLILVWDFSATYAHYLKHRIPFLWEFHKVHHSAEVMTPVTATRRHPFEDIFSSSVTAVFIGAAIGLWYVVVGKGVQPITIFGVWSGLYLWRLLGYNLRHTHVWISYGNFWNRIFISPAQHQIHHSVEPEHYDKNFGHIFAFWDRFLGTLYLPAHDERVKFGIEPHDMEQFRSLKGIYWTPFVKGARLVGKAFRKPARQ